MTGLIIGAYAALPADQAEQEQFYAELPSWVSGIEIPYRENLADDPAWLVKQISRFNNSVVTAIPGTMARIAADPDFGLASPQEEGRRIAVAYLTSLLNAIDQFHDLAGERLIRRVQLHSAPSDRADKDCFARSLAELLPAAEASGVELVVEHCDAATGVGPGEKRFLSLADELEAVADTPVRITINWGRSAVETHDADTPRQHIEQVAAAGRLAGLMFSGAGPEPSQYGQGWADVHLPGSIDEPTSLMTTERIAQCLRAAGGVETYRGIKIQVPGVASVEQRLAIIGRIAQDLIEP